MKKYNLSKIMKRAWELVKGFGFGISEGLKKAWKEAKEVKKAIMNMKGTEKQVEWAMNLMEKMHEEFAVCKEIAPVNAYPMFDKIESILNESYAGDVIDLLKNNKAGGQEYFANFRCAVSVSANVAAMKIKKEVR